MVSLIRTQDPASEPLTLAEAKLHLRVAVNDDDSLITNLITAARMACEQFTSLCLITQGWKMWMDQFSCGNSVWWDGVREGAVSALSPMRTIALPRAPLQGVTAITIYDDNDTATVFSPSFYFVDAASMPGRVALRNNATWPVPQRLTNGISIDFTAGYGASSAVPQALKQGMLLHIGQMYEHRGEGVRFYGDVSSVQYLPDMVQAMYQPFRIQHLGY